MATAPHGLGCRPSIPDQRNYPFTEALKRPLLPGESLTLPASVDRRTELPACYDQLSEGSCFPPGTHIRMADGSERHIEDLKLLDLVVTAEGNVGRVMANMVRMETSYITQVKLRGHGHLRLTAEHPILTKRGYIPARDLQPTDYVALPKYMPAHVKESILVETYVPIQARSMKRARVVRYAGVGDRPSLSARIIPLQEELRLSPALGRILGLFLAEGSITGNRTAWTFNVTERGTLVAELVSLLGEELGVDPHIQIRPNNSINVVVYGQQLSRLLHALCGNGAGQKALHPDLCSGSRDFLEAVLRGWLDGDGWRRLGNGSTRPDAGKNAGISISQDLAMAMYDIAQALGLRPAIQYRQPTMNSAAKTRRPIWTVLLNAGDDVQQSHQDETHTWRKIREIGREPYCGPVYNLSVEGDQSYVAEGIGVHNCTAFATGAAFRHSRRRRKGWPAVPAQGWAPSLHYPDGECYDISFQLQYWLSREKEGTTDVDAGASIKDAIATLHEHGAAAWHNYPYRPDQALKRPPAAAIANAARHETAAYYQLDGSALQLRQALAAGYLPVIGVVVYNSIFGVGADGLVPMPRPGEAVAGGHALCVVGYTADGHFLVRNSWSQYGWGMSGYCLFPEAYLTNSQLCFETWAIDVGAA